MSRQNVSPNGDLQSEVAKELSQELSKVDPKIKVVTDRQTADNPSENFSAEAVQEETEPPKPPPFILAKTIPFKWAALTITIVGGVMALFILKMIDSVSTDPSEVQAYSFSANSSTDETSNEQGMI